MKGDLARYYYSLSDCSRTLLSSVIWLKVSKKFFFEYAGGRPILIYHRDNSQSHSNSVRVSNHLIYSFTRILDYHDKYYYLNPVKWLNTLGLFHNMYYGTPFPIFKNLTRASTIIWCILVMPIGVCTFFEKNIE